MQVDFARALFDYKNEVVIGDDGHPVTLRRVATTALATILPDDKNASIDDKMKRDELAGRVWNGKAGSYLLELPVEDVALIKKRVNATYPSAALVAAAVRAIEAGAQDGQSAHGLREAPSPDLDGEET